MDEDVARMLADLGVARRDLISTPVDTRRETGLGRNDAYQQRAVLAAAEARRTTAQTLAGGDAQRASTISAWNCKSS